MSGGHAVKEVVELVGGATNELLKQGGKYGTHQHLHGAAKGGELLVKSANKVAPGAVAAAATAVTAAAPVVAPVLAVAGIGYLTWCVGKWVYDEFIS